LKQGDAAIILPEGQRSVEMETRAGFHQAMEAMKQEILAMGVRVEEALRKAVDALIKQDVVAAREVMADDQKINAMETGIEDRCITLIATEQPVALDLRRIVTEMKIVTQLERMGDHARHVAKAAVRLAGESYMKPLIDIPRMGELCAAMVHDTLTAFVENDADRARSVARVDTEVDALHKQVVREVLTYMMGQPQYVSQGLELIFVSRFIERTADHATNIAEWIVYCETGKHAELNE
jgi:phosphate transport system protein